MKVIIVTDLEGLSLGDTIQIIDESTEDYQKARVQLMKDTNAAIDGAFAGGAKEVFVVDGHCSGKNFIPGQLDPRAQQILTSDFVDMSWENFDALLAIGYHAKAGTEKAFLDHTQSSASWFDYCVGGKSYGEIGQLAITGGAFGVPFVMISGDAAACEEAKGLVDNIAVAVVKEANERNRAICLPEEEALKRIFEAAADGVRRYKEIKPYSVELPTKASVTLFRTDYCDQVVAHNKSLTRSGRTLTKNLDKIMCFRDVLPF